MDIPLGQLAKIRTHSVELRDVRLHVVEAGPADGRPIVLLHGFPEFWFGWWRQLAELPASGLRVIAPDQRGYNLSEKPQNVEAYTLPRLADDVRDLLDALHLDRIVLAGHDWGGAVAWWFAMQYPDRLRHLVALSSPHPVAMGQALRKDRRQRIRSLYMLFFQIPWLAERVLGAADGWLLARGMRNSRVQGEFTPAELTRYREAWRRPKSLQSMLNWYRALLRHPPELSGTGRVQVPVTLVWGDRDPFFSASTFVRSGDLCARARSVPLADCGHWAQHERPERINQILAHGAAGSGQVQ